MRTETAARTLFLALFAFSFYLMFLIFRPMIPGIAWAVVLVVAFYPLYSRLVRWFRGRAWAAATLLSALLAAFIVVPAVFALIKVAQGVVEGYQRLEAWKAEGGAGLLNVQALPWWGNFREWAGRFVDLDKLDMNDIALSALKTLGNTLAGKTSGFVADALATLLTLIVLLVTMVVLFHEGPGVIRLVRQLLPLSESEKDDAIRQLKEVTRSVFYGVLLTAVIQAMLGAIGFAVAGVPAPATLGAALFFCALLPAGTVIVWGPAGVWLLLSGHTVAGIGLLIWGGAVVSTVDNFLRPVFIGRGVKLHTLLVFFGIFGGLMAFGLIGLFTGPLVITLFLFLLEVARKDIFRGATAAPTDSA